MAMNPRLLRPTAGLDIATVNFRQASGATNVAAVDRLVRYLKAQNLWDYARLYPMKSAQNAGSGSTVYGLGGLTSNNMTLVNSPTWGSDGVTFASASSQYGTISDFLSDGTISFWLRAEITETGLGVLLAQFGGTGNQRSVQIFTSASQTLFIGRSPDGISSENYEDGATPSQDTTLSAEWADEGGRTLWADKTQRSLSLAGGSANTSRFNSTAPITVMAQPDGAIPADGTVVLAGFIETALTITQRETITDLINAL
jgi:hypothetical protein